MPRFVALIRGVNVGKGNRVPMADLKLGLQALGCSAVATVLNSGNAVFSSTGRSAAGHAQAITGLLQEKFGVATPVIVKAAAEFKAIVDGSPTALPEAEHPRFLVVFSPSESALAALAQALPVPQAPERLVFTAQAAYLHCPGGLLASQVAAALLGKAGRGVTTRNWATVLKVQALLSPA